MLEMTSGDQLCSSSMTSLDPQLTLSSNTIASHSGSSLLTMDMTCGWETSEATPTAGSILLSTPVVKVSILHSGNIILTSYSRLLGLYYWWDGPLWPACYDNGSSGRDNWGWSYVCRPWDGDHSFHGHVLLQARLVSEVRIILYSKCSFNLTIQSKTGQLDVPHGLHF